MLSGGLDPSKNGTPPTRWAWEWVRENMDLDHTANEMQLTLMRDFEPVTFGTADFAGLDKLGRLTVIDYKSGQQRDYYYQLVTYALAAMQKYGEDECRVVALYGKTETVHEFSIIREDAEAAVFGLIDRLAKGGEPRLCDYCGWCEHNGTCDATAPAIVNMRLM
jgi:CRISPR/Cas system-associated exonuclease Cas4 (RecB family)